MKPASSILFVDDEPRVLEGIRDVLWPQRRRWAVTLAQGGDAALKLLAERTFDVVVTDLRMPGVDGFAVLERLKERHPRTVRLVLSGDPQRETAMKLVPQAHRALLKPCRTEELRAALESACALGNLIADDALRAVIGRVGDLPPMPQTYARLLRVLESERSSLADVTAVVQTDIALSAKVLQLSNSALFGVTRPITSIADAIGLLGSEQLRTIALAEGVFTRRDIAPTIRAALSRLHEHSLRVAQLASERAPDPATAREAFAAAMLHDIGRLVLTLEDTAGTDAPAEHARVGAYLLGLWGVPATVIDAVAQHHAPPENASPLAALIGQAEAMVEDWEAKGQLP